MNEPNINPPNLYETDVIYRKKSRCDLHGTKPAYQVNQEQEYGGWSFEGYFCAECIYKKYEIDVDKAT